MSAAVVIQPDDVDTGAQSKALMNRDMETEDSGFSQIVQTMNKWRDRKWVS